MSAETSVTDGWTMPGKNRDIQQKLHRLRQQYAEKLPDRISALEQQWQALNLEDPQSAQYDNLIREFHSLAGSGTSFGYPEITTLSREIEHILLDVKSTNDQISEQVKTMINARLSSLKQAATQSRNEL